MCLGKQQVARLCVIHVIRITNTGGTVRALEKGVTRLAALLATMTLASGCAQIGDSDDPVLEQNEAIAFNAIAFNAIAFNALSANVESNKAMANNALADKSYDATTGDPALRYALHDELTREFMKYTVGCALEPGQAVKWHDPFDGNDYKFDGMLGLCPKWAEGPASAECRQVVSSCLLSRVNAFGVSVRLSQRGHDSSGTDLELAKEVPAGDTYANLAPVVGFNDCAGSLLGPNRECGWDPGVVGQCTPGTTVTVGAGAPAAGYCGGPSYGKTYDVGYGDDSILRVCEGIVGCAMADVEYIGQADNTCGSRQPSVTFTCPSSGYYTTMVAHTSSTREVQTVLAASSGAMPASEKRTFAWREGAFYGDIWDASALDPSMKIYVGSGGKIQNRNSQEPPDVIYHNMFACWSDEWTYAEAYMKDRVCAGSGTGCAATPVGACQASSAPGPTYVCGKNDGGGVAGDLDYQDCKGNNGTSWKHAITVFLNDSCDVVPDESVCKNPQRTYVRKTYSVSKY